MIPPKSAIKPINALSEKYRECFLMVIDINATSVERQTEGRWFAVESSEGVGGSETSTASELVAVEGFLCAVPLAVGEPGLEFCALCVMETKKKKNGRKCWGIILFEAFFLEKSAGNPCEEIN